MAPPRTNSRSRAIPIASTSTIPTPKTAKKSNKRRTEEEVEEVLPTLDSLGLGKEALSFGSDGEDDEMDEIFGDEEGLGLDGDDGQDDEEAFPELDFGESEDDGDFSGEDGEEDEDEDSEDESLGSVDPDEEAALLAEIEAEDALSSSSSQEDNVEESDLDAFLRRNTSKPNENDTPSTSYEDPSLMKDYMRRSRKVISEITGIEKTKWDEEIDAGYGSDSSTEEVSTSLTESSFKVLMLLIEILIFHCCFFVFLFLDDKSNWKCTSILLRRFTSYWI